MLRTVTLTITLSLATLLAAVPAAARQSREYAHVRPVTEDLAKVLEEGVARSATLRSLVERLEHTDVAVLMEFDGALPPDLSGGLRFITRAGSLRLLRVSIRRSLPRLHMIATIGHELQHAIEIADAPDVLDQASFNALYRRIDSDGPRGDRLDTLDAQRTGDQVMSDLLARRHAEETVPVKASQRRTR